MLRIAAALDQVAYWQPSRRWMGFWAGAATLVYHLDDRRKR